MSNFLTAEDAIKIMQGISEKTPQGIMIGNTTVGHITWQMYLMRDYLKLDGTPLANASNDYSDLLKFAQDNNLITADTTDKSLFKYDSTNNVLTLPDFIGLVVQGGSIIEEKEAGLPNITGITLAIEEQEVHIIDGAFHIREAYSTNFARTTSSPNTNYALTFDASRSSSIYGNSTTVQPPAIQLIPQIKYKRSTVYEGIELGENYSTEEQRIGTWIDGKPLYRKVFLLNEPIDIGYTTWTETGVSITDNNILYVISVTGYYFQNTAGPIACYPILCSIDSETFSSIALQTARNGVGDTISAFMLKYTKTTD